MNTTHFTRIDLDATGETAEEVIKRGLAAMGGVIRSTTGKIGKGAQEYRDELAQAERESLLRETGGIAYRPGKTRVDV